MPSPTAIQAKFPEALSFLHSPARYKVAWGGRGSGKSWSIARSLLLEGAARPLRVLCAREFQSSIQDSVHRLLADQIAELGLGSFYAIEKTSIKGLNGTLFGFEGIRHNVNKIKSYEGVDRAWIEEAQTVSRSSWETLIPTIRKTGSEIWVSFNPVLETDETYERFVLSPPPDAVVHKVNWQDNPWFPAVLQSEMQYLKSKDFDAYLNIWEGHCRVTLDGAIFAKELRAATTEGRICRVPHTVGTPVQTFWDLGWADCTSIWFAQKIGFEYQVVDFYQNRLEMLPHYVSVLQNRGYVYGTHYLPHDGDNGSVAAPSVKTQLQQAGYRAELTARPKDKRAGIDSSRAIFNRCYFDAVKCKDGIQALRHYRFDVDEQGQWSKEPLHDDNSHAADAFQTMGLSIGLNVRKAVSPVRIEQYTPGKENLAWLG